MKEKFSAGQILEQKKNLFSLLYFKPSSRTYTDDVVKFNSVQ